jgi:hypothetical protein
LTGMNQMRTRGASITPKERNASPVAAALSSSVCRMLAKELVTNARLLTAAVIADAIGRPLLMIMGSSSDASEHFAKYVKTQNLIR